MVRAGDEAASAYRERAIANATDPDALAALARLEGGEPGAARARSALALDPTNVPAALALAALATGPDVIQMHCKLRCVKRSAITQIFARCDNLIPRLEFCHRTTFG